MWLCLLDYRFPCPKLPRKAPLTRSTSNDIIKESREMSSEWMFEVFGKTRDSMKIEKTFFSTKLYSFPSSFSHYRKARRKERDGDASQSDTKIYLEESVLELLKFTPADLRSMVDLPAGVDYNEWLASFSKCQTLATTEIWIFSTFSKHLKLSPWN